MKSCCYTLSQCILIALQHGVAVAFAHLHYPNKWEKLLLNREREREKFTKNALMNLLGFSLDHVWITKIMMYGWVCTRVRKRMEKEVKRKGKKTNEMNDAFGEVFVIVQCRWNKHMQIHANYGQKQPKQLHLEIRAWKEKLRNNSFTARPSFVHPNPRHISELNRSACILKYKLIAHTTQCTYTHYVYNIYVYLRNVCIIQCINKEREGGERKRERERAIGSRSAIIWMSVRFVCMNIHCIRYNKWLCGFNIRALITHFLKRLNLCIYIILPHQLCVRVYICGCVCVCVSVFGIASMCIFIVFSIILAIESEYGVKFQNRLTFEMWTISSLLVSPPLSYYLPLVSEWLWIVRISNNIWIGNRFIYLVHLLYFASHCIVSIRFVGCNYVF